jgi:hypothetical protein
MKIFKMSAAAVISSLVFGTAAIPAWSGTTGTQSVTAAVQAVASNTFATVGNADRSWLEPSAANARTEATANCKPGHVYSQHDVVGDPDSCWPRGNFITLGIAP